MSTPVCQYWRSWRHVQFAELVHSTGSAPGAQLMSLTVTNLSCIVASKERLRQPLVQVRRVANWASRSRIRRPIGDVYGLSSRRTSTRTPRLWLTASSAPSMTSDSSSEANRNRATRTVAFGAAEQKRFRRLVAIEDVRFAVGSFAQPSIVRVGLGMAGQAVVATVSVGDVPRAPVEVSGRTTRYRTVRDAGRTVNEKVRDAESLAEARVRQVAGS